MQLVAFVHGHRGSWHNPDMATDLHQLFWDRIEDYLPLSRKYFESFGPWFWSFPSDPARHLQNPIATGEAATNGSFLKHEVLSPPHDPGKRKDVQNALCETLRKNGLTRK